jgi:hypothetical protein
MSHKQFINNPREFPAWLRTRAEGHSPEYDITVYARPPIWLALADAIDACLTFDPTKLSDGELILCLEEMRRRDAASLALSAGKSPI